MIAHIPPLSRPSPSATCRNTRGTAGYAQIRRAAELRRRAEGRSRRPVLQQRLLRHSFLADEMGIELVSRRAIYSSTKTSSTCVHGRPKEHRCDRSPDRRRLLDLPRSGQIPLSAPSGLFNGRRSANVTPPWRRRRDRRRQSVLSLCPQNDQFTLARSPFSTTSRPIDAQRRGGSRRMSSPISTNSWSKETSGSGGYGMMTVSRRRANQTGYNFAAKSAPRRVGLTT